uniref:Uncharacterized protein n=1 Tax=Picea glauca TaxID=3330 RepID=A0A117NH75_PICGL|nr:hypothetical protein ABT39_MTgene4862 [Picea glauca]
MGRSKLLLSLSRVWGAPPPRLLLHPFLPTPLRSTLDKDGLLPSFFVHLSFFRSFVQLPTSCDLSRARHSPYSNPSFSPPCPSTLFSIIMRRN